MTPTMSVLFVESYPHAMAGQQETLKALLAHASDMDMRTRILLPGDGVYTQHLEAQGHFVEVIRQPSSTSIYGGAVYNYSVANKFKMFMQIISYIARVRKYLRREKFDLIYCNDMRGLLTVGIAARLCGIPVMIWDKLDKPHGFYDALQLPIASRNLMITESVSRKYPDWQKRVWSNKLKVVHNGINIERFQSSDKTTARKKLGLRDNDIAACIIGTVSPRKGHDILMSAYRDAKSEIADLKLFVLGSPEAETAQFAASLKSSSPDGTTWLGYRTDIAELLPAFDMILSPSRYEGMGRVNIEAMAAGLPVVGTWETGIAEVVVHGETGFLIDQEDSSGLRDAMVCLTKNSDLRAEFGRAARERARAFFGESTQIRQVLQELKDLAKR